MKKLNIILNNKYLWWFILFLILAILFLPILEIKFSWIDDAKDILVSRQVAESLKNFNPDGLKTIFFEGNGRLRVVYWFYQTFEYLIGGTNATIHFAIHIFVILATSLFIFETVRVITNSKFAGFFSGALYLLVPINTENIFRLGPVEPILALFSSASLYFLFKNKLSLSVVFLFLAAYSKETGFVLWLPILLAYVLERFLYKKRNVLFEKYCLWGFIFLFPVVVSSLLRRTGYSTNYEFVVVEMAKRLFSYIDMLLKSFAPFLGIFVITYLTRLIWFMKKHTDKKYGLRFIAQGIFIGIFLVFVSVQAPWKYVLERYMMPATIGLVVFLGIELAQLNKLVNKNWSIRKIATLIFIGYFLIACMGNLVRVFILGQRVAYETNSIHSMVSYVARNSPENSKVVFNFITGESTIELVNGSRHLLTELYSRHDIATGYLNIDLIGPDTSFIIGRTGIRAQYSEADLEDKISYSSKDVLFREKRFPVITTPDNLVKQLIKKVYRKVRYEEDLTLDGIYTQYIAVSRWYFYKL